MARENTITLVGRLLERPVGSLIEGYNTCKLSFNLSVMRKNGRIDKPHILVYGLTIEEGSQLFNSMSKGDYILVRGMVTTKMIEKKIACPSCGHEKKYNYLKTEIVAFSKPAILKGDYAPENFFEVSNNVQLLGEVCSEIQSRDSNLAQYQLAVERTYHVNEQGDTEKDYPWIKSFQDQARDDEKHLKLGSVVYIKGAYQTREIERQLACECCGEVSKYKEINGEIITQRVEYLHNCLFMK